MIDSILEAIYGIAIAVILFWAVLRAKPPLYVEVAAGVAAAAVLSQLIGDFL